MQKKLSERPYRMEAGGPGLGQESQLSKGSHGSAKALKAPLPK